MTEKGKVNLKYFLASTICYYFSAELNSDFLALILRRAKKFKLQAEGRGCTFRSKQNIYFLV